MKEVVYSCDGCGAKYLPGKNNDEVPHGLLEVTIVKTHYNSLYSLRSLGDDKTEKLLFCNRECLQKYFIKEWEREKETWIRK